MKGGNPMSDNLKPKKEKPPKKGGKKKIIIPIVCVLLVAALGVGGWFVYTQFFDGGNGKPGANAPAHEHLFYESDTYLTYARQTADLGVDLQAEYTYGLALAPVSSLRLCVDNILWLKGEGETVEDVIGAAPYGNWDDIVAAGLGSPMPFYFEGLVYQVQGMDSESADCYKKAKSNPIYTERDFYYLKSMSVDELYKIRNTAVEKELAILDEYTPRVALYAARTGAEFAPVYHMALCSEKLDMNDTATAYGCALNAVMSNPQIPDYYGSVVLLGLQAEQGDTAAAILNEGLFAFPKNGELNYIAATLKAAEGDNESAKAFLQTAMADTELSEAYKQKCQALQAQIGG
jgi:hypothetical protein